MVLIYLLLASFGMLFLGLAGGGALAAGLFGYRLNRYRYRFMGLPDHRNIIARFWRQWKFSLYQPVLCIALALLTVTILSLVLKPLAVARVFGGGDISAAALQVGSIENKLFELTNWLKSGPLLNAFLTITIVLLLINLLWPNLKVFNEAPKLRVLIRNVMVFLTTLTAFSFVSGTSINTNRATVTASLRRDINKNNEKANQFNAETAAIKVVSKSIDSLTSEQIRQLAAVVRTVGTVANAAEISRNMGREAGNKIQRPVDAKVKEVPKVQPLEEVADWPTLEERRTQSSNYAKRSALIKNAANETLLASLDSVSVKISDQLGGSMNRLSKSILGSFFSGMTEAVSEVCSTLRTGKKISTDEDLLKLLDDGNPRMTSDRFFASWLDDIPDADNPDKMAAAISKRVTSLDADINARAAAKAAKSAADAADAAKAAKAAKSLIRVIF